MKKLLELLATHGGKIVSTNDLTEMEIKQARASNRIYVDEDSLGYIWLPPFHGRFPVTVSEVEMFEWCYPTDVKLLESLSWNNLKKKNYRRIFKRCSKSNYGASNESVSNSLLDEDNDIDTVGKCANCGIEFHIHKELEMTK